VELVIGTRAWSSWSLRPWLALRRAGAPFTERLVELRRPDTATAIAREGSPSGRVPFLRTDDGEVIWDSLAICEWAADAFPQARLWPADATARALARAVCAEVHAGFAALRAELPMDLHLVEPRPASRAVSADVRRLVSVWTALRGRYGAGGPFLFGDWSIADAFYTPTATRLRTYDVDLAAHGDAGEAADYVRTLLTTPEFLEWEAAA
jgi:glutathione S-transferase